ncbi:MAG: hypothetical protein EB053_02745 [Chlamydiae bacterium]|nr:hypothetical protein [Chlamydiota bacterium]
MNPVERTNLSQLEAPQQKQSPSSGITVLSPELLDKIIKSLPEENQRLMGGTCKTFHEIIFSAQKEQVLSFLKRSWGGIFTKDLELLSGNSKNLKEFKAHIKDFYQSVLPMDSEADLCCQEHSRFCLEKYAHTQLEDLSTIILIDKILDSNTLLTPIMFLPGHFYEELPLKTVDRLVDMLIEKYTLPGIWEQRGWIPNFECIFPHSRKLLWWAHQLRRGDIRRASERLKDDKEFICHAILAEDWRQMTEGGLAQSLAYRLCSDRLKDDKDVVLAAIRKEDRLARRLCSDRLKDDTDLALAAIRNDVFFLDEASASIKDNKNVVLAYIWRESEPDISLASERLRDDIDVVLASTRKYFANRRYASERLKNTREVILAMMPTLPINLRPMHVPVEFHDDPEILGWFPPKPWWFV